jgi:arabinose-5-phosphate isomerase
VSFEIKSVKQTTIRNNISQELISVISKEIQALDFLVKNFPPEAENLVEKILQTKGRVVFSGMGKSGLVAKKLVATFASTGTPALFLHPSEALHGDLGMLNSQDLFIAISKSGTGAELEQIIPLLRSQGNFCSLIACVPGGSLTKVVDLSIVLPFKAEACELNLAPTSSSTLCMAFGDALAVVASKIRGFGKNDYAKFHPAGALGKNYYSECKH